MRTNKQRLRSEADRLAKEVCLKLNDRCLLCGGMASTAHHFKPKGLYGHMRYMVENLIPICFSCHFKLTFTDSTLQAKIAEIKGFQWFRKIDKISKERPASYQTIKWYQENIDYLKGVLEKL